MSLNGDKVEKHNVEIRTEQGDNTRKKGGSEIENYWGIHLK